MTFQGRTLACWIASVLAIACVSAHAQTEITGERDGAFYRAVVPDDWNGRLVVWGRGLDLTPLPELPDLGPLAELQLSQGFAVAASSYSQVGWSLFSTRADYASLLDVFTESFGEPTEVIMTGGSLGGLVAIQAAERLPRRNISSVYTICGPVAGSRNFDTGIDLRLVYDAVCAGVEGAEIPGGELGLPPDSDLSEEDIAERVNVCTGVSLQAEDRSPEQSERLRKILDEITVPESFLLILMDYATRIQADLINDPEKLEGRIGTGNRFVRYDDPEIDAAVARVSPRFGDAVRLFFNYEPIGRTRDTKILSLHTDKDGLVFVENETELQAKVPEELLTVGVVVEDQPTHCGFTEAEVVAGWEELLDWLATGVQPSPEDIQRTCRLIEGTGLFAGPCRVDPAFVLAPYSNRTPERIPSRPSS